MFRIRCITSLCNICQQRIVNNVSVSNVSVSNVLCNWGGLWTSLEHGLPDHFVLAPQNC